MEKFCCLSDPVDPESIEPPMDEVREILNRDYDILKKEYECEIKNKYPSIETGLSDVFSTKAFDDKVNKKKNRYQDVPCWDHSRVVLAASGPAGSTDSDYIHANYVDGMGRKNKFIATQAPMSNTIIDFLNMIWQNDCAVIVVLTEIDEEKQNRMFFYWSTTEGVRINERYIIKTTKIDHAKNYTKYTLEIENIMVTNEPRRISLYHYTDWEMHVVPKNIEGFIKLILDVNTENMRAKPITPGPIVVHCNAGVCRTGSFCVIDICLDNIFLLRQVKVLDTVKSVRAQRHSSIFSADHYALLFLILKIAVKRKLYYYY
ncbi:GfV-B6-ORF1 [Ichnoviriform fumiferanae]|uniref:protein-tyrosine-phosphatase n=1 Tax=Ichnoviriform fumiferanae TaxID=419435 RepID=A2PZQ5_9VIRU|nr:GfV-B6-ORF1 [Ichnoviriform fumiferanae]BAF45477.1 GfV-B6-ORF1 [Ichnoviriform fumiferanae]